MKIAAVENNSGFLWWAGDVKNVAAAIAAMKEDRIISPEQGADGFTWHDCSGLPEGDWDAIKNGDGQREETISMVENCPDLHPEWE